MIQGLLLVTGSSNGIGLGLAREALRQGWTVVGVDREEGRVQHEAYTHCLADLTLANTTAFFTELLTRHRPDLIVHCAGIGIVTPFSASPVEKDEALIALNVVAAYAVTKAFVVEAHRERRPQHLILLSSLSGITATPGMALYAGSKHFVSGLAKSVEAELAVDAPWARLSTVSPSPVRTKFREHSGRAARQKPIRGILEVDVVVRAIFDVHRNPKLDFIPGFWPRTIVHWLRPLIPHRWLMNRVYLTAKQD